MEVEIKFVLAISSNLKLVFDMQLLLRPSFMHWFLVFKWNNVFELKGMRNSPEAQKRPKSLLKKQMFVPVDEMLSGGHERVLEMSNYFKLSKY